MTPHDPYPTNTYTGHYRDLIFQYRGYGSIFSWPLEHIDAVAPQYVLEREMEEKDGNSTLI